MCASTGAHGIEETCSFGYARVLFVSLLPEMEDAAFVEHGVMSPVMRRSLLRRAAWRLTLAVRAL